MDKYKIPCTEEQTKKALELGAPIKKRNSTHINNPLVSIAKDDFLTTYIVPTAEEMIGWLEEQGILIDIHFYCISWDIGVRTKTEHIIFQKMAIDSRKEATLAAIDVALEYLTNNK